MSGDPSFELPCEGSSYRDHNIGFNPFALRTAKTHSECSRVKKRKLTKLIPLLLVLPNITSYLELCS